MEVRRQRRDLAQVGLAAGLFLLGLGVPSPSTCQDSRLQWRLWQKELVASKTLGANPYRDVVVPVEFKRPSDGRVFVQDAFWQANSASPLNFKVRAALPAGSWEWRVLPCTGHANCSGVTPVTWSPPSGTINVTASTTSGIKLYDRGFPTQLCSVTSNGVSCSAPLYADYTPFIWAADTAWTAPPREIHGPSASWVNYLDNRRSKQFSTILIAPAVAWQPAAGDLWPALPSANGFSFNTVAGCLGGVPNDCSTPRREYWEAFDNLVQQANQRDLLIGIVGMMDPLTSGTAPNLENAKDFARFLSARMAGNAAIVSPAFDHKPTDTTSQGTALGVVMDAVGNAIKTGRHLISNHMAGGTANCTDYAEFRDNGWMNFYLFQSGHAKGVQPYDANPCPGRQSGETALRAALRRARQMPLQLLLYTNPRRASINGEALYDAYPSTTEPENAFRARHAGYYTLLSSSSGYTYGTNRLVFWYGPPSSAFDIASAGHMQVLYNRFRSRGAFTAQHGWILNQKPDPEHENKMVLASPSSTFVMAYLPPANDRIQVSTSSLAGLDCGSTWTKRWYNARNTNAILPGTQDCTSGFGNITILRPTCSPNPATTDCDFVLELERTGGALAASGAEIGSESLAVWSELAPEDGTSGIWARRVRRDGTEYDERLPVSPPGLAFQTAPRVARGTQSYFVVWQADRLDGSLDGIFARRLDRDGQPRGDVFQVNEYWEHDQRDPAIASSPQGNLAIVWSSYGQDGDLGGIYARRFAASAEPNGGEFHVNLDSAGFQARPQVAHTFGGNLVVAWESDAVVESPGNALVARVFQPDGRSLSEEIRVGRTENEILQLIDLEIAPAGGFTVRWKRESQEGEDLGQRRQRFDAGGTPLGPPEETGK